MSPEQKTVRQNDARPAVSQAARNGAHHATAPAEAERLPFRVSFAREGEYHEENSRLFSLSANRWERLEVPLPGDWQGGGLRMQPRCRFGLLEIVGVRVVSGVMGELLWERLGRDLIGGVEVSAGMQVLSNKLRLRLLCTGDDARIVLPDLALPSAEVPLVLELGLRVRTDLASIGYTLHEWVDDANTRLRDALGQMTAAETARTHNESWAKALLAEVEVARADGNRREAALQDQLAGAHEAARTLATTLTAEIAAARTHGEERAATLLAEIDAARADGNRREAALQEQLAAAHEAARAHAATLLAEIAAARAHGEERAAALATEIGTVRAEGDRREAAWQEQFAGAHEAARALAVPLTTGIVAARSGGEQGVGALPSERAAAPGGGNAHASALVTTINEVRWQIERGQEQILELRESAVVLQTEIAKQHGEVQRLEQTLSFSNQQKANVQAELAEVRRLGDEHRGRVRSMQRSFSWRLTLPLRIVGRALTGRRPASHKGAS